MRKTPDGLNSTVIVSQKNFAVGAVYPVKKWLWLAVIFFTFRTFQPALSNAGDNPSCLTQTSPAACILITSPDGHILYKKNGTVKCIPASTLKILTALAAIRHLGLSYRFRTEFYIDSERNLKIKGYGDPLLTSEVWRQIAEVLSTKTKDFNDLVLDNSYFSKNLTIPGVGRSANPYDAPLGALCANFNTVFFDHDAQGRIISAEPQTPMTPFVRRKIKLLGLKKGRYTFSHDQTDTARYAGELFLYFLHKKGIKSRGTVHPGLVSPEDKLIYSYLSRFTLEDVIKNMMAFSNNFVANQICITMGAQVYGSPGTLEKGVKVISNYAKKKLRLDDITVVEGSGISRKNRISALDMETLLDRFRPYRHLLKKDGHTFFKTGTLDGVRTRVGYLEASPGNPYNFVVFLNNDRTDMDSLMACIEQNLD